MGSPLSTAYAYFDQNVQAGGGGIRKLTYIYVAFQIYPPPCDIFARNELIFIFSISNPRYGRDDPKSVFIVISGKSCPYLVMLDFFILGNLQFAKMFMEMNIALNSKRISGKVI